MKLAKAVFLLAFLLVIISLWRAVKPYYTAATPQQGFEVIYHDDDTLRITLLGDSWAEHHKRIPCSIDTLVAARIHRPVQVKIAGISGLTSKNIYYSIFRNDSIGNAVRWGPDYCFVMAGINDSDRKMGCGYYKENMRLLISFLLEYHIKPVVLEIPDYDPLASYHRRNRETKLRYLFSMMVTLSPMNCIAEYRTALSDLIREQHWSDKLLLLSASSWNPKGYNDSRNIYDNGRMHLNTAGYGVLDLAIAELIANDILQ